MHVRYYTNQNKRTTGTISDGRLFKNVWWEDIFKIINGTHTSVDDFNSEICNKEISVFDGTLPSVYKDFGVRYSDLHDSDNIITFTKMHSEADSDYKFARKIDLYCDYNTYSFRARSGYPDSDTYDAFTPNPNYSGRSSTYNQKIPSGSAAYYTLNAQTQTEMVQYHNLDYIDINMTKNVFTVSVGYEEHGQKMVFILADGDVRKIDKIAYNAVFDSDRRVYFNIQSNVRSKLEKRTPAPMFTIATHNYLMGRAVQDFRYTNINFGGVFVGMQGEYYSNGQVTDDSTNTANMLPSYAYSWNGGPLETDPHLYLLPDPYQLQNPMGDSDNEDYHILTPITVYSQTQSRANWNYSQYGTTGTHFAPVRSRYTDRFTINVRNNLKGIYRSSDAIGEDGDTVTIDGIDYVIIRAHKTGDYQVNSATAAYEACYLIPKTAEDN